MEVARGESAYIVVVLSGSGITRTVPNPRCKLTRSARARIMVGHKPTTGGRRADDWAEVGAHYRLGGGGGDTHLGHGLGPFRRRGSQQPSE